MSFFIFAVKGMRMTKVIVYRVRIYDAQIDGWHTSRRWATGKGVEMMGGVIIPNSEIEIDTSQLESGEEWTARDYNPSASGGFQRQVYP